MKFIKNQFSLWRIVLFIGVTAIAIPIAASLSPTVTAVEERQEYVVQQTAVNIEHTDTKHGGDSKAAGGKGVRQNGYYWDRRRQYWEDRLEDDLDDEDEDEDTAADKKDSKAAKDDEVDDEGLSDEEYDRIERRREYWRQRLEDEDW